MHFLKKYIVSHFFISLFSGSMLIANEGVFSPSGTGIYMEAEYYPIWAFHTRDVGMVFTANSDYSMKSTLLSSTSHPNNISNGTRLSFTISPNRKTAAEFRYSGFIHWRYKKYYTSTLEDLYIPLREFISQNNYYDWANLSLVNVSYDEYLWIYELLFHFYLTPRDVDYFSFAITAGGSIIADNNSTYYFSQKVNQSNYMHFLDNNRLYGAKAGGVFRYRANKRFSLNLPVLFGMYANMVVHNQYGTMNNNTEGFTNKERSHQYPSYTIEANPQIRYELSSMYFLLGYQYLGIFNLAYSNMQTSFYRISWHGDLQSQGGLIGLGIHW